MINKYMLFSYKEEKLCPPKVRQCYEEKHSQEFNCSVSCVGLYADVEWMEEMVGVGGDRKQKRIDMKGEIGRKQSKENSEKVSKLLNEYNDFKKKSIRHFYFNATTSSLKFGKNMSIKS